MKKYVTPDEKPQLVSEPAMQYATSQNYFERASKEVSKSYIQEVLSLTRLQVGEMIELIPISIDTYKRKTVFNASVSEKILEIEEVYKKGLDAFGEGFFAWMDSLNPALGGIKPKVLLSNSFGIRTLLAQIGRMQYGVLA